MKQMLFEFLFAQSRNRSTGCSLFTRKLQRGLSFGLTAACFTLAMIVSPVGTCHAQSSSMFFTSEGIMASGSAEVALVPNRLRLQVLVKAEDRDAESVLKILRKHQARVETELKSLGADVASIVFSQPVITTGIPGVDNPEIARKTLKQQAAQMRNLNPQMRGQFPGQALEDDEVDLPFVFTATCTLTAEWTLPNGLSDEALVLVPTLRAKVDEKDFRGKKLNAELDPSEIELIQPLLGANVYYSAAQAITSDVQLQFVATLSEAQEQAALDSAFAKAQAQAERLAKASGRKLTKLQSMSSTVQSIAANLNNYPYVVTSTNHTTMTPAKRVPREVSAEDPNQLARTITVNVSFACE